MVFQKLSVDTSASNNDNTRAGSNTPIQTQFYLPAIPPTPGNVKQVTEIEELISLFRYQTLDSPKLTLLYI